MKLGFAGTVRGMTDAQLAAFKSWIEPIAGQVAEFRSGGCIGADEHATAIVCETTAAQIILHRQNRKKNESAKCVAVAASTFTPPAKPDLRNAALVDAVDVMVLAPRRRGLDQNGGTFGALRYAKWRGKPLVIIWPDGEVEEHGQQKMNAGTARRQSKKQVPGILSGSPQQSK